MYVNSEIRKDIVRVNLLTDRQMTFDHISHKDLMSMVAAPIFRIVLLEEDTNFFGDFMFIRIVKAGYCFTAYSLGFHHESESYVIDGWKIMDAGKYLPNVNNDTFRIPSDDAIKIINEKYLEIKGYADKHIRDSERGELFEMLSELGDEDGAYAMLDDMGF